MWKKQHGRRDTNKAKEQKCRSLSFTPSSRHRKNPSRHCGHSAKIRISTQRRWGRWPKTLFCSTGSPRSFGSFHGGSFNECEKQALLLTNAVTLKCPWTVAAHSTFALEDGVSGERRQGDPRGEVARRPEIRRAFGNHQGPDRKERQLSEAEIERFTSAGYSQGTDFRGDHGHRRFHDGRHHDETWRVRRSRTTLRPKPGPQPKLGCLRMVRFARDHARLCHEHI